MNTFLAELGKRVAERWLSLLVLPGALYLAVAAAGSMVLRHSGWYDLEILADYVNRVAARRRGIGQVVLIGAALLLGSGGVGLVAQSVSGGVTRLWLAAGRGPVGRRLTGRRRKRWQRVHEAYRNALLQRYRRQQGWGRRTTPARCRTPLGFSSYVTGSALSNRTGRPGWPTGCGRPVSVCTRHTILT